MTLFCRTLLLILFTCLILVNEANSQCNNPPNGVDCLCSTATILCTPDELDNFTFSMSTATNYGGFGQNNDLCPGIGNQDGIPNNVNWFAFIAWCNDLTMDIAISNCSPGTNGSTYGVQLGLFAGCNFPWDPLQCITESNDACGNQNNYPTSQTISVSGLTIGNVYYFMLDGCLESACDITIDVIGVCGNGMIDPWTTGLTGPTSTCVGNTDTYVAEDLDGAVEFYYYLDGTLIEDGTELTSIDQTWSTPGNYQLCVDVSNLPCILESDEPQQNCIDIIVCEAAEAGTINIDTSPACPGETINFEVTGYTDTPDSDQYLIITDISGSILEVNLSNISSYTSGICEDFKVFSYNVKSGSPPPTIGSFFPTDYPCSDNCCDFEEDIFSFEDDVAPVFTTLPDNTTLDCDALVEPIVDLDYTDNCIEDGTVVGVESGTSDPCNGGSLTREWTITDMCDNTTTHVQVITVNPLPIASFLNPPADMTVSCDAIPTGAAELLYNNGETGLCAIDGMVPPVQSGTADLCGGDITFTWEYTDDCNRTITHPQVITVLPVPSPQYLDPPADITVECADIPASGVILNYTNNETGDCIIEGTTTPTMSGSADLCGGTIIFSWEYIDVCDVPLNHEQTITVNPVPESQYINPPGNMTVTCDMIPTGAENLLFTNNGIGDCQIAGEVVPVMDGSADECGGTITFTWEYIDVCDRPLIHTQIITVEPAPPATLDETPESVTISCSEIPTSVDNISFTNNDIGICLIEGEIEPVQSGSADECGGTITYTWQFIDDCGRPLEHTQTFTVDPAPQAAFLDPPASMSISCSEIPTTVDNLSYTNNEVGACLIEGEVPAVMSGSADECGGVLTYTWMFIDDCDRPITHIQNFTVDPAPQAEFINAPDDVTVSCEDATVAPPDLDYDNGETGICAIAGSESAVVSGVIDECGGTLTITWTHMDKCGRVTEEEQIITALPAEQASFTTSPADVTINCDDVLPSPPVLDYTNNESGICIIEGDITAIQSGSYDVCGGSLTYTWNFTDNCGRTITESQLVTVNPAPSPFFVDPPDDLDLGCQDFNYIPPSLLFTNQATVSCLYEETIDATLIQTGNSYEYTWTATDPCTNVEVTHIQTVTVSPFPDLLLFPNTFSICEGNSFELLDVLIVDQSLTNTLYTYHSATPPDASNEIPSTLITPTASTTIYVLGTNEFGCTDESAINIIVDPIPFPGEDGSGTTCNTNTSVDLFSFLNGVTDFSGTWTLPLGLTLNLNDPFQVSFISVAAGLYDLTYTIDGIGTCPDQNLTATIEVFDELEILLEESICSDDLSTYTVTFSTDPAADIDFNAGNISQIFGGLFEISDIPIGTPLNLVVENFFTGCFAQLPITPPNCDCPNVDPPVSNGNEAICVSENNPSLSVLVNANETANWYDNPTGTNLLAAMTLSYTPTETSPGLYTYYVQTESLEFEGCLSSTFTTVTFEIIASPTTNTSNLAQCDTDMDGIIPFDLSEADSQITSNNNVTFTYYDNLTDATSSNNALTTIYNNTTPWAQTIYVVVSNSVGCTTIDSINLVVNPIPDFTLDITNQSCFNTLDGSVNIENIDGAGTVLFSLDNVDFTAVTSYDNLDPGSYTLYSMDDNMCSSQLPFEIAAGLDIQLSSFVINCQNNNTDTDPNDDFYLIDFTVTNNNGDNGMYDVLLDGSTLSSFPYGNTQQINIPADSSSGILSFEDADTQCAVQQAIGPLTPCSTNCQISIETLTDSCNSNGTESDPSDDYYDIELLATAINGSANNSYNVLLDGIVTYNFMYGDLATFTLPADGTSVIVSIVDNADSQCQSSNTIGPLTSCSSLCVLNYQVDNVLCNNEQTENDALDDTYTFDLIVSGVNTSGTWSDQGSTIAGNYDMSINLGPFLISDGPITYTIIDSNDPDCSVLVNISPPVPCSSPCVLDVSSLTIGDCNDNNTGTIEDDDFYSIDFTVETIEGIVNQYTVTIEGVLYGPFAYGTAQSIDNLIADGTTITAVVNDITYGQCVTTFDIVAPSPCSSCDQSVEAGDDVLLDCNVSQTTLEATSTEDANYQWNGPNFFQSMEQMITVGAPGTYVVVTTYQDGCTATDSVMITVSDDVPIANAGPDQFITCEDSLVSLTAIIDDVTNIEIVWTDSEDNVLSNQLSFDTDSIGDYYLQLTDTINNCISAVDEVQVIDDTAQPIAIIYADPGNVIDCVIESISLTNEVEDNVVYEWTFNNIPLEDLLITIREPGEVNLYALDTITGCDNNTSLVITDIQDYPLVEIDPPAILDCINNIVSLNGSNSQSGTDIVFTWYDSSETALNTESSTSIDVMVGGEYYLELIDTINGCSNRDTVFVDSFIELPELQTSEDQVLFCGDNTTTIQSTLNGNISDFVITWSTLGGTILSQDDILNPQVEGAGTYTINVFNPTNNCEVTDSIIVITNLDIPQSAIVNNSDISCFGEVDGVISIDDVVGGTPPYTYSINGGPFVLDPDFTSLDAGQYEIEIQDAAGCGITVNSVIEDATPFDVALDTNIELIVGAAYTLNAQVNIEDDQISSIVWNPSNNLSCDDCLNPTIIAQNNATYSISVTDLNGCVAIASIALLVAEEEVITDVYIPNVFSPNGDNSGNDTFTLFSNENIALIEQVSIYDRWGELVFRSNNIAPNDPTVGWDGNFKGAPVAEGVYVYVFDVRYIDDTKEVFAGDVTVLR